MRTSIIIASFFLFSIAAAFAQPEESVHKNKEASLKFVKKQIASESFESAEVFDVNNDKIPDIVSGSYWYEGPTYFKRHFINAGKQFGEYWDDFSTIPIDLNGDGRTDFVTGGWFRKILVWEENPGNDDEWKEHIIAQTGNVETTRAWDVDGDGVPEIIPNTPNDPLVIYRLKVDGVGKGTGSFDSIKIYNDKQGHGLGFGDINRDGRGDFVLSDGWLESPANPFTGQWIFHKEFSLGTASVPIIVTDVNKDGLADLIVGQAHSYGLDWYEHKSDKKTKTNAWIKHPIDPYNSQFHTMQWTDIDGDGKEELITGKRYRAHNGHDPGETDPIGIYYYKWNGESFTKQIISYGSLGEGKGLGIYFGISDLTGSGKKDIIAAGKDGLCIFYNKGFE